MMVTSEQSVGDAAGISATRRFGARAIVLIVALGFLAGAIGYFVGVKGSKTATSAVDAGFLADMSDHHDQAVQMALMELAHGQDRTVKGFAQDVLLFQRSELGEMKVLFDNHDTSRPEYDTQRSTMAWMGTPIEMESMTGLASPEELAQLDAARGIESDLLFLSLMSAHHGGGLHMAQYAAEHSADPRVKELASRMAKYQAVEVREYKMAQARLGVSVGANAVSGPDTVLPMPGMAH